MTHVLRNREEYNYVVANGFQPLIFNQFFEVDFELRVDLQKEVFGHSVLGKGNVLKGNQRFYEWCWKHITGIENDHICQNCLIELFDYSAKHISHIIARSNEPAMAHDPRNVNILCGKCHSQWEDPDKNKDMNIYILNQRIINLLKQEYRQIQA